MSFPDPTMREPDLLMPAERATVRELRCCAVPHVEALLAVIDRLAPPPYKPDLVARPMLPSCFVDSKEPSLLQSTDNMRVPVEEFLGGSYLESLGTVTVEMGPAFGTKRSFPWEGSPQDTRRAALQWIRSHFMPEVQ